MKRSLKKGLPGGPNEKVFSKEGYRSTSPDVNNPFNIIPSGSITMKEKDGTPLKKGPLLGFDNLGNSQLMLPGANYQFPGDVVKEVPLAKKGGQFQNSNIYATNKLFAKNPLFKKRKKGKKAKGIYNPKAKYTYNDGGESGCPLGFIWNGIECIPNPFETRPSQRAAVYMDKDGTYKMDPVYQQYSQQKFDVAESNKKAQDFNKLYAQSKNYKRLLKKQGYTPEEIEDRINSIMNINDIRYTDEGPSWVGTNEDTGNEFISYNVTDPGDWPGFDQIAAHEWGHVGVDSGANPLKPKEREEFINRINKEQAGVTGNPDDLVHDMEPQENRADLLQLRQQLQEAGVFDSTKRKRFTKKDLSKYRKLMESSKWNWDNMWNRMFRLYDDDSIIYFMNNVAKNNSNEDLQVAKYGFELDLTEDEIQKYVKGGYVVEDISIPSLTRMDDGGTNTCPPDHYWNGEACVPTGRTYTPIDPNYLAQHPDEARRIINEGEVSIEREGSDIGKLRAEFREKNPMDTFLDEKKRQYLKKNKGLNKAAGVTMENFPEDVLQNFMNEYDYKTNNYAVNKLGKKEGWNPKRRGEWVDELTPGERDAVAESKYGSKLQPSYWSRSLAGLQELGNEAIKLLPGEQGDVMKFNIPGLTKKEQKEIRESKLGALETFAPMDIPGAAIANLAKNTGLTTGSDYKEQANALAGEKMANVTDIDALALNPLTYAGLESLPELGISLARGLGKGANKLQSFVKNARDLEKISKAYNPNLTKAGFSLDMFGKPKPKVNFIGPMRAPVEAVGDVLTSLRKRGSKWDAAGAKGEELLHPDMINYHGTYAGRPIVEVRMPDGTPEFFYKSSGWAGKEGAGRHGTTEGMWQPFGGFSDTPATTNWFIKDKGYKDYYGSNTFKTMAENLDNALMQKHGFKNIDELENAFNFQNRNAAVDSYTPIRKYGGVNAKYGHSVGNLIRKDEGGFIAELNDNEIKKYLEGGYIVEEID